MTLQSAKSVKVFYSYAPEDENLRDELEKHLANLKRQEFITDFYDRDISAGAERETEINKQLEEAGIILLLISPDFMNSDYCHNVEVKRAMERHEAGEARVIPVILRHVDWEGALFGKLQPLPTDARPVNSWDDHDEAFLSVTKGIRKAIAKLPRSSSTVLTLPGIPRPPVIGFVARRDADGNDIVESLKKKLAPQQNNLVTLSGPGGIGKTTLAAETARGLREAFAGRVVWSSAQGRTDFTLSSMLDEIATQLGRPDLRPLAPDAKGAQVGVLVAEQPTLIVLDNYETIKPDVQLLIEAWFTRAECSALFTSRPRVGGIATTINVVIDAMSREEAQEFLERTIAQTQDAQIFSDEVRRRIYETAEANPFVMQWVVGQIDDAQEPQTVLKELAQGEGDAAERVFDRSFNLPQLGDDGRAALLALSLFAPSASRDALAAVAGFGADSQRMNRAIKNLRALWLIKALDGNRRFTIEGLTRSFASARLSEDPRATEFRQRFVAYFRSYAGAHAQTTPEDFDALEVEKDNILSAMDRAFDLSDWTSVMQLMDAINFDGINGFLSVRGYWDEAIRRGEQSLKAAKAARNEWHIGAFANGLGVMLSNRGDYSSAKKYYELAVEVARRLDEKQGLAATLHQLARLAEDQGDVEEARPLYNESLEISKSLGNQNGVAGTLHQLGILAQNQGEIEEARRLYNESLEISKKLNNQNNIAGTLHQLGILAQNQGEIEEARQLYNESLEIKKRLGHQRGIALTSHNLAAIAANQGDVEEARRLYNESLKIAKRLGSQSNIAITLHELGILAQNQGKIEEARQLYIESLEIKKRLGNQSSIAITLHDLARLEEKESNKVEAVRLMREAFVIFEKLKSPYAEVARQHLERLESEAS